MLTQSLAVLSRAGAGFEQAEELLALILRVIDPDCLLTVESLCKQRAAATDPTMRKTLA